MLAFCLLLLCLAQLLLASDYSLNVCLNKYQYWIIQSAELFILFAFLQQSTILLVFVVLRSFDSSFRKWARQLFQQVLGLFSVHQLCQSKGTCSDFSACVDCWGTNNSNICFFILVNPAAPTRLQRQIDQEHMRRSRLGVTAPAIWFAWEIIAEK